MENIKKHFAFIIFLLVTTLVFSIIILVPNYKHYPIEGFTDFLMVFGHWFISTLGLYCLLFLFSLNRYVFLVLFPLFTITATATAVLTWQFDVSINSAVIESILLTNIMEASGFATAPMLITLAIAGTLAVVAVLIRFRLRWSPMQGFVALVLFILSISAFWLVNHYRFNTLLQRNPYSYYLGTKEYLKERKELSAERIMIGKGSYAEQDTMVVVFVIGEALRADHIQMNGYHRTTMPNMEKREVISLPHLFSPYTHTAKSLPYMLTRADSNSNDVTNRESSFIDAFNHSSFYTAWIGNQNPTKTYKFYVAECDTVFINKPQISDYSTAKKMDSDLIEPFANLMEKPYPKMLVNLHLIGNHWWYNSNYPDSLTHFTPVMTTKVISHDKREEMINSYDNATRYTDYVLEQIIQLIEDRNALLIFLSDHGQSFGEEGKWLHANNTLAEQNPAGFIWFSEEYRAKNSEMIQNVLNNQHKHINTSFLFHTILHGATIQSTHLDLKQSLFSSEFEPMKEQH